MSNFDFDYLVLGAGSGGIATANRAASFGKRCAVIESQDIGGTCVNRGCVPKKVMWYAGQVAEALSFAPDYGFNTQIQGFDWSTLTANRTAYIERIHQSYQKQMERHNIQKLSGVGRFHDSHSLEVDGQIYSGEHIVVATGAYPVIPDIPGAELGITSDGFFALEEQPKRVAIVGAGYIAVELAGVMQALGSETTLLIRGAKVLKNFDSIISESLTEEIDQSDIVLQKNTSVQALKETETGIVIESNHGELGSFDQVIWAIGRRPATQDLNLEAAGVELNQQGFIQVDALHNTSQSRIYAIGDNTGETALTPLAVANGRRLAERLFNDHCIEATQKCLIPSVVFSHPPVATIGLTEKEAIQQFGEKEVTVYQTAFTAMYSAITQHRQKTHMKLICTGADQKIQGLHMLGFNADEILQGFAVAITMGATKADFDRTLAIHPTSGEEWVTMT